MGTKGINKFLSFWWARIFIYSMLCSLFFIGIFFISDIIDLSPTVFVILTTLCFLIPGLLIESLRAEGKSYTLGFRVDKHLLIAFLTSLIFCSIIFGSLLIISLIGGADYNYNTEWNHYSGYVWNTIILLICYSLTEELIFRGLVFQTLSQRFNPVVITFLSALAFSIAHSLNNWVNLTAYLNIFLAGILFAVFYLRTLSLWLPFFFHFLWNLFQALILGLPVSGYDFDIGLMKLDLSSANPALTTIVSDKFGIEGGIFTSLVMLCLIIYSLYYLKPSPYIQSLIFKRKYAESFLNSNKKMVA